MCADHPAVEVVFDEALLQFGERALAQVNEVHAGERARALNTLVQARELYARGRAFDAWLALHRSLLWVSFSSVMLVLETIPCVARGAAKIALHAGERGRARALLRVTGVRGRDAQAKEITDLELRGAHLDQAQALRDRLTGYKARMDARTNQLRLLVDLAANINEQLQRAQRGCRKRKLNYQQVLHAILDRENTGRWTMPGAYRYPYSWTQAAAKDDEDRRVWGVQRIYRSRDLVLDNSIHIEALRNAAVSPCAKDAFALTRPYGLVRYDFAGRMTGYSVRMLSRGGWMHGETLKECREKRRGEG